MDDERPTDPVTSAQNQAIADLLLIGALAAKAPVVMVWIRTARGTWEVRSRGIDQPDSEGTVRLRDRVAARRRPTEIADLGRILTGSPLLDAPWSLRWAYGAASRDADDSVVSVVVLMDRYVRTVDRPTHAALTAMVRSLDAVRRTASPASLTASHDRGLRAPDRSLRSPPVQPPPVPSTPGQSPPPGPELMRASEVAAFFSVTPKTIANWAATGKLPSLRTTGGHLRFLRSDVEQLRRLGPSTGAPASTRPPASNAVPGPAALASGSPPIGCQAGDPADRRPPGDATEVMTASGVAAAFSVTSRTVIHWARTGRLPYFRTTGGHLRFLKSDVDRLRQDPTLEPGPR